MPAVKKVNLYEDAIDKNLIYIKKGKLQSLKKEFTVDLKKYVFAPKNQNWLHMAALVDFTDVLRFLTQQKIDVIQDLDGNSPLHLTAIRGHFDNLNLLLDYVKELPNCKEIINFQNTASLTVFDVFIDGHNLKKWDIKKIRPFIDKLSSLGAHIGRSLPTIIYNRQLEVFFPAIEKMTPEEVNDLNPLGYTALNMAIGTNQPSIAQFLLKKFSTVISTEANEKGYTPVQQLLSALLNETSKEFNSDLLNFRNKKNYELLSQLLDISTKENWNERIEEAEILRDKLTQEDDRELITSSIKKLKLLREKFPNTSKNDTETEMYLEELEEIEAVATTFTSETADFQLEEAESGNVELKKLEGKQSEATNLNCSGQSIEIEVSSKPNENNNNSPISNQSSYKPVLSLPTIHIQLKAETRKILFGTLGKHKLTLLNKFIHKENFFLTGSGATISLLEEPQLYCHDLDILCIGDIKSPPQIEGFQFTQTDFTYNKGEYFNDQNSIEVQFINPIKDKSVVDTLQENCKTHGDFTIAMFYIDLKPVSDRTYKIYAPEQSFNDLKTKNLRTLKPPRWFADQDNTWPLRAAGYEARYGAFGFKLEQRLEYFLFNAHSYLENCTKGNLVSRRLDRINAILGLLGIDPLEKYPNMASMFKEPILNTEYSPPTELKF